MGPFGILSCSKSESRIPKSETNPKLESRNTETHSTGFEFPRALNIVRTRFRPFNVHLFRSISIFSPLQPISTPKSSR
jgi:hypothetical protein